MGESESADFRMGGGDAPDGRHFSTTMIGNLTRKHEPKRRQARPGPKRAPLIIRSWWARVSFAILVTLPPAPPWSSQPMAKATK